MANTTNDNFPVPNLPVMQLDVNKMLNKSVTQGDFTSVETSGGVLRLMVPFLSLGGGDPQGTLLTPVPPPYWSFQRDVMLRASVHQEAMWGAAVGIAITRMASLSWEVQSKIPLRAKKAQDLILSADTVRVGVSGFIAKQLRDFLTTDNGEHFEIVRATGALSSQIIGLRHLDSLRCLGRDTRITLSDGSVKSISEIVRNKMDVRVKTVTKTGEIVDRKVIGWHETPLADRYWLHIHTEKASFAWGKKQGVWATNDHEFLTPDGWAQADCLKVGDRIFTQHRTPSDDQYQVMVGTLLGDASMSRGKWSQLTFSQGESQLPWLKLKMDALSGFTWGPIRSVKNKLSGKLFHMTQTERTPGLDLFFDAFYGQKNTMPRFLIEEHFTPLMLATLYMDDGDFQHIGRANPSARIALNSYSQSDVDWFAGLLTEHGYTARVHKRGESFGIYITTEGSKAFFRDISPYILPELRYKIPADLPEYDPMLWSLPEAELFEDSIESIERGDNGQQATSFCIDVEETHNFFAGDMCVHNCIRTGDPDRPIIYRDRRSRYHELRDYQVVSFADMPDPSETYYGVGLCAASRAFEAIYKLFAIEWYMREKVGGLRPLEIYIVNGMMDTQIKNAVKAAEEEQIAKGVTAYMGAVIIGTPKDSPPELVKIPLAEFPDRFNRKEEFDIAILTYANSIGLDPQELQPLTGQALGTGAQSQVLSDKQKGKGLSYWRGQFTHMLNEYVLDEMTTFLFVEKDYRDQLSKAQVELVHAQVAESRIKNQITSAKQEMKIMIDDNDLPKEFMPEDTTPDGKLDDAEKPDAGQADETPIADPSKVPGLTPAQQQAAQMAQANQAQVAANQAKAQAAAGVASPDSKNPDAKPPQAASPDAKTPPPFPVKGVGNKPDFAPPAKPLKGVGKEYDGTGAMVALFIPEEIAKQIAVEDGQPPADMHITLAFLGDVKSLDYGEESVVKAVKFFASTHRPIVGSLNGRAIFNPEDDGIPVVTLFDATDLPGFRQDLIKNLTNADISPVSNHGFTPHITLDYAQSLDDALDTIMASSPEVAVTLPVITVAWGGNRTDIPLSGGETTKDWVTIHGDHVLMNGGDQEGWNHKHKVGATIYPYGRHELKADVVKLVKGGYMTHPVNMGADKNNYFVPMDKAEVDYKETTEKASAEMLKVARSRVAEIQARLEQDPKLAKIPKKIVNEVV